MSEDPRSQLIKMASDEELQSRWTTVREMMRERGIDYLIMQNGEEFLGGTLRWFTDWEPDLQFPFTVIFPVDDEMTVINWGHERPNTGFPPAWYRRGIKNAWGAYYMPTHNYTSEIDAALAVEVLSERKNPVIGWVEKSMIPVTFYEYVTRNVPGATFVDATDWIDHIRASKSPEEVAMIRDTAAMQDECFDHLRKTIVSGMRGYEIYAEAIYFCSKRGSSRMNCMISSAPFGTPATPAAYHLQGRQIKSGDQVFVLVESNGPGGQWTELARTFVIGAEPPRELVDAFGHAVEGQELAARHMVPGADPKDIVHVLQEFNSRAGYSPELFDLAHGMGYSMVERPMIRRREPMKLPMNGNLAVHLETMRSTANGSAFALCVDNFLVGPATGAERVHAYPKELILV